MSRRAGYAVLIHVEDEISRAIACGLARGSRVVILKPDNGAGAQDEIVIRRARERLAQMDIHGDHDANYWSDRWVDADLRWGESRFDPTVGEIIR